MSARHLLVLAWGNDCRGDDALGPAFLAQAEALPDPAGVTTTFVCDYQLQPEHAIDLDGHDLVLFVDASLDAGSPYDFSAVEPTGTTSFSTHGVAPGVVLDAYRLTYGRAPPPAFQLAIRGESFDLGAPLGAAARRGLEAALGFFTLLRRRASARAWSGLLQDNA